MSISNLDQIDATIDSYVAIDRSESRPPNYHWPCGKDVRSEGIEPLISVTKGYTWHGMAIEEIPGLIGLAASHPAIEGRCMIFGISPSREISGKVDVTFVRYEHLVPSLSVISGDRLTEEIGARLKHDVLSLYCTSSGYFWLRKGIYGLW